MSIITPGSHRCIFEWTVQIPSEGSDRRSNAFSFNGHEVHLIFHKSTSYGKDVYEEYGVELDAPPSFPPCPLYDLTVQVETIHKTPLHLPSNYRIGPENKRFWYYSKTKILNAYPDFIKDGVVTFLIWDVDPPKPVVPSQEEKSVQTPLRMNDVSGLEKLSSDLYRLLQDQDQVCPPDLKLQLGNRTIGAHSQVLSARSKIFSRMLQSDMSESRNGQIEVKDMECENFKEFIRYLYTGKLSDLNVDTARALYEAGDQYDMSSSLMRQCSSFLEENLTPDNVCEMLVLADAHSDQDFKEKVIDFIVKWEIPKQDDQWLPFCEIHPKLGMEVLSRFCKFLLNKQSATN